MDLFPRLMEKDIDFLKKLILDDEIKRALFDMAPLKASGMTVCEWVQEIFAGNKIKEDLNNILIALIPKKEHPVEFSHFQPISLCSVMYKLVMKVIANRFNVVFLNYISSKQVGFITGHNISDNIIIAQEVIHSMHSRKLAEIGWLLSWIWRKLMTRLAGTLLMRPL
ncbi:tyrosine decarboxylase 1-like [Gossypium australe]|uniref:Tyrosine decarboxylase 1-like n=1 Tax=Gossypium australe TaxID=47621 RepID=A0A5B6W162_9ROSI|nr:tyrosine decarboxylase 1-like [Gossypium australe]